MADDTPRSTGQDTTNGSARAPLALAADASAMPSVADLSIQLSQLQADQSAFITAEITHLRELSLLNRMSDALAMRRTHEQILEETLREAAALAGTEHIWLIEPNGRSHIGAARDGQGRAVSTETPSIAARAQGQTLHDRTLPLEARDLCDRILSERLTSPLTMPTYDPLALEGLFIGMPMASAEHLMGILVVFQTAASAATGSERQRLLQSLLHQAAIACENAKLFGTIGAMIVDVVVAMALAIESRDPYTGGHVQRVTGYALRLGRQAGLDDDALAKLRLGGMLHDIGKVAVPDAILRKNGKLDPDEYAVMQTHAAVGHQIVSPIPQLAPVAPIIRHHHERWDGKGYPDKLAGRAIDPLARITAIADTFDAMTSDRPYRKGLAFTVARAEIAKYSGSQFDPDLALLLARTTDEELRASADQTKSWCGGDREVTARDFLGFLDIDRPKIA